MFSRLPWMRRALVGLVFLAPAIGACARPVEIGRAASGSVTVDGHTYIDVQRWALQRGFAGRWNSRAGELTLNNRWASWFFKADTRRCEFAGATVSLSFPVVRSGERLFVALRDEETILRPLMDAPRLPRGRTIQTVAINAGHGGRDPGNLASSREEKTFTLALAQELERLLRQAGLRVVQVRDRDVYVPREDRPRRARQRGADLYVSLHFNATPGGESGAAGLETYCLTPAGAGSTNDRSGTSGRSMTGNSYDRENIQLAYQIHRAVLGETGLQDRGVRHARFKELTLAEMPAVLVEGGYMTNPEDARRIFSETGRSKYAQAIADGILAYKRLVERGQPE